MGKKRKKFPAILLLIAMIASLAACGGGTTESNGSSISDHPLQSTDELPTEVEQEPEIIQETIEDKAKTAIETLEVWDGSVAESFDGGDGSAENPYQIATAAQLAKLAKDANSGVDFSGTYFVLTSDILLNDISEWDSASTPEENFKNVNEPNAWTPISAGNGQYFNGNFDGSGYTVWGVYQSRSGSDYGGFFGHIGSAEITNLTLACNYLQIAVMHAGVIVGCVDGSYANINNCNVLQSEILVPDLNIKSNITTIGGIAGSQSRGSVENCYSDVMINTHMGMYTRTYVGGVSGHGSDINNCYSTAYISVSSSGSPVEDETAIYVGGIYGYSSLDGNVTECYYTGNIDVHNDLGWEYAQNVEINIGGIGGGSNGSAVSNCASNGNLSYVPPETASSLNIGGILGYLSAYTDAQGVTATSSVTFCYSNTSIAVGSVIGYVGGIIGGVGNVKRGDINITDCYYNEEYSDKAVGVVLSSSVFTNQLSGLTEDELCSEANYIGWDFTTTWIIDSTLNNGLPIPVSLQSFFME